jgi:hypothetical protein
VFALHKLLDFKDIFESDSLQETSFEKEITMTSQVVGSIVRNHYGRWKVSFE